MKQIWLGLPEAGIIDGLTMEELQELLKRYKRTRAHQLRPAVLLEALKLHKSALLKFVLSSSDQGAGYC